MSGVRPWLAALLALLALEGCTLARGDRELAAGDEAAAARAYERAADGALTTDGRAARALLRLGVLHAQPTSPLYDPAAARGYLDRVRYRDPDSPLAREAELLLAGLATDPAPPSAPPDLVDVSEPAPADLPAEELPTALESERRRAEDLDARIATLSGEAERLRDEIARLEAELAQLKTIDLAEPPH